MSSLPTESIPVLHHYPILNVQAETQQSLVSSNTSFRVCAILQK